MRIYSLRSSSTSSSRSTFMIMLRAPLWLAGHDIAYDLIDRVVAFFGHGMINDVQYVFDRDLVLRVYLKKLCVA